MPNAITLLAALPTNTLSSEYFVAVLSLGRLLHIPWAWFISRASFVLFTLRKKKQVITVRLFLMDDTTVGGCASASKNMNTRLYRKIRH